MPNPSLLTRVHDRLAERHPSAFLLAAQMLLLLFYVIFDGLHSERAILSAFGALVLVLVLWVVSHSPAKDWVGWLLAVPAVILTLLTIFFAQPALVGWSALLSTLLYFYAAGSLIAYMLNDTDVTRDELFAAGATFTLLGWGFTYLLLCIQVWLPVGFLKSGVPTQTLTFLELLSLSFTNLSATGLSDITPLSAPVRAVIILEQTAGIGYVAVVVSRLIGLTVASLDKNIPRSQ